MLAYHVTRRSFLESIYTKGLVTNIPTDYGDNGDIEGVYLFRTIDDTQTALSSWLGERIEEMEEEYNIEFDEVVLEVDLTGMEMHLIDEVENERISVVNIPANRIVRTFDL